MTSTEAYKAFKENTDIFCTPKEIADVIGCTADTIRDAARNGKVNFPFQPVPLSEHRMKFVRNHVIKFIEGE